MWGLKYVYYLYCSSLHHTNVVETVDLVLDENHHWCEVMVRYEWGRELYININKKIFILVV